LAVHATFCILKLSSYLGESKAPLKSTPGL